MKKKLYTFLTIQKIKIRINRQATKANCCVT